MRGRLAIFAGAIALAVLLPAAAAASAREPVTVASRSAGASKTTPRVLTCPGHTEVRPRSYLMSCGDANASWKNMVWTSWGPRTASGTGDLYQNDCTPNCASGHFHTYPAKVVLSGVKVTKKFGLLYSRATFSYSVKGQNKSEAFELAT